MNVNVDAKGLGGILKDLPFRFVFLLLTILSALLIFLPDVILKKMFLLDLRNKIGTFLGIAFIISGCVTLYLFVSPFFRDRRIRRALSGKRAKDKFVNLPDTEKQIVSYMYYHRASHILLPSTNAPVIHLKNLLMISEASVYGNGKGTIIVFPYFLQQWVIKLLDENPDLLSGVPPRLPEEFELYIEHIGI